MLESEEEDEERAKGLKRHGFNELLSDKIGLHRNIPDWRSETCKAKVYPRVLPKASIVICFYNEAWSTLLRSVHSILDKTPLALLEEIILIDDNSYMDHLKTELDNYVAETLPIVRVYHSDKRLGLIRARMLGAHHAKGELDKKTKLCHRF
nr:hypothetical protein BaRGS_015494 [Batillaria attramentaria]